VTFDNPENPFHLIRILENVPERLFYYEPFRLGAARERSAGRSDRVLSRIRSPALLVLQPTMIQIDCGKNGIGLVLLRNYEILGAEGVTRTPFCFTGFFTAYAKTPMNSHFSLLRSLHRLHYQHSAVP
jgi:hypothetical protein